ncbi:MAG: hypothetical protein Ta2A_05380 [Treponemataceae bacterium]|nr:MAG: hypothetical protein Ta2A_05380 [Treponemataceae bacterium]
MKKVAIVLLLIMVLSPIIYFCFINYAWQTVLIPEIGTFKVPQDWVVTQKENTVYITNKAVAEDGYIIYIIGARNFDFFENVKYVETVRSEIFSNSSNFAIEKLNINGNIEEKRVIGLFYSGKVFHLLVWDNSLNEKTLIRIVKSFVLPPERKRNRTL